jgi:hypothetical protein
MRDLPQSRDVRPNLPMASRGCSRLLLATNAQVGNFGAIAAEHKIEHAHNAGIDRDGLLDLKCRDDNSSLVQPNDVKQPDGVGVRMVVPSRR